MLQQRVERMDRARARTYVAQETALNEGGRRLDRVSLILDDIDVNLVLR